MAKVVARENEPIESLIRRFKKQVKLNGIIEDYKKHDYFIKKGLKRKEKSKRARILNHLYTKNKNF